jgi:hypothetical protein
VCAETVKHDLLAAVSSATVSLTNGQYRIADIQANRIWLSPQVS